MSNLTELESKLTLTLELLNELRTERQGLLGKIADPDSRKRLDDLSYVEIPNLQRQISQLQASISAQKPPH